MLSSLVTGPWSLVSSRWLLFYVSLLPAAFDPPCWMHDIEWRKAHGSRRTVQGTELA
jgi:hypothetical protein